MTKNRIEAFPDSVLVIINTIVLLDLRPPYGTGLAALGPLLPTFLAYGLSFVYVAIYLEPPPRVSGGRMRGWVRAVGQ